MSVLITVASILIVIFTINIYFASSKKENLYNLSTFAFFVVLALFLVVFVVTLIFVG